MKCHRDSLKESYDKAVIDQAIEKATHKNRNELLNPTPKKSESSVTFGVFHKLEKDKKNYKQTLETPRM